MAIGRTINVSTKTPIATANVAAKIKPVDEITPSVFPTPSRTASLIGNVLSLHEYAK